MKKRTALQKINSSGLVIIAERLAQKEIVRDRNIRNKRTAQSAYNYGYITLEETDHNTLKIVLTPEGREFLEEWKEQCDDSTLYELFEQALSNGWKFVSPEDIAVKIEGEKFFIPDFKIGDIAIIFRDIHSQERLNISFLRQR